ncbi:MAG: hypothetical protein GY941_25195 [Planctomycetes bacterium]|nr:hypothetical protein [Planctomycetota bacterium]
MSNFTLNIELSKFNELDQFALLACQKYNYGNNTDWFGSFRGGLYGSFARIHGLINHYYEVHTWKIRMRHPAETEYQLASIFFNMDSFVECITYAFNALGFCFSNSAFRDVTKSNELRRVSPYDILGRIENHSPQPPLSGYKSIFPSVQNFWKSNYRLLSTIFELHDVSKHRETIFTGGMVRGDPPAGFYKLLGIDENTSGKAIFSPMKEIILKNNPKTPRIERVQQPWKDRVLLEDLVPEFQNFIVETGIQALDDAKTNIPLKVDQFEQA